MTEAEAIAVLIELDYIPGSDRTTQRKHRRNRDRIKAACNVLGGHPEPIGQVAAAVTEARAAKKKTADA